MSRYSLLRPERETEIVIKSSDLFYLIGELYAEVRALQARLEAVKAEEKSAKQSDDINQ